MDADDCVKFLVRIREQEECKRMYEGPGRRACQANHEVEEIKCEDLNGGGLHYVNKIVGDLHDRVEKG